MFSRIIIIIVLSAQLTACAQTGNKSQLKEPVKTNNMKLDTIVLGGGCFWCTEAVFLRVFAGDKPFSEISGKPGADGSYSLSAKLKPGLVQYRIEFGSKSGGVETVLHKAANLLCGDAYIIIGQSNAVATDFGKEDPAFRSEWIRTFGTMSGNAKEFTGWGDAVHRSREGGKLQVGYWGMELGKRIVESHKMPVFLINGAVGGTRVDQHQRNEADPEDLTTIYGRLLWRLRRAKLTHGVRGIIWHQGENDMLDRALCPRYAEGLDALVGRLRADLGAPELKWYLAEVSEKGIWGMDNRANLAILRQQQDQLLATDPLIQ